MKQIILFLFIFSSIAALDAQSNKAKIKIEKTKDGETTIIEKEIDLDEGADIDSILEELGVLDDLGNVKDGQSFEINILKKDGLDATDDITIEYFEQPNFNFLNETKAFLGVMLADHEGTGVRISSIIEGTKAEEAGLLPGDILTSINGVAYETVSDFVRELGNHKPGEMIVLSYQRGRDSFEKEVELGEKAISGLENRLFLSPEDFQFPDMDGDVQIFEFNPENEGDLEWHSYDDDKAFLGISPGHECTDKTKGVPIGEITPNSAAEEMGLQSGDILQSINGDDVETFSQIAGMVGEMSPGDHIKVGISRNGKKQKLKGTLGKKQKSSPSDNFFFMPESDFDFDINIEGQEELELQMEQQLEQMLQELDGMNLELLDQEDLQLQIEQLLSPMLENYGEISEEIRVGIIIETITDEDLKAVNGNASVDLKKEDDLELDFINYFPNPVSGTLNLNFKLSSPEPYQVLVYDQTGRTVFEDIRSISAEYTNTIDLSALASGSYYLQIVQTGNTFGRKLVKN